MTKDEILAVSNRVADEYHIPRLLLLACGIAESNLNPLARRPRNPSQYVSYWPDVSGGVWQQTVRWSYEYNAAGYQGEYPGDSFVEKVLTKYYDVEYAAKVAALRLRYYWVPNVTIIDALCRYNKPNVEPTKNPNRNNYLRGIREAQTMLADDTLLQLHAKEHSLVLIGLEMSDSLGNRTQQFQDSDGKYGILLEELAAPRTVFTYYYADRHNSY